MSTADKVRQLAESGAWASAIATELGVSRQHVYQVARRHKIDLPQNMTPRVFTPRRSPQPRIQTGGIMAKVNHSVAGTISELLVAADLMARGWQVFLPVIASRGHDVIATKDGKIATFEVRSAHRNATGTIKFARKADCLSDYYGLVITGEPVAYEPDIDAA